MIEKIKDLIIEFDYFMYNYINVAILLFISILSLSYLLTIF